MNMPVETTETNQDSSIFYNAYELEALQDNLAYDKRKTRNTLLILAAIFLVIDFISIAVSNALTGINFLYIIVLPIIFTGLAFLSRKAPVVSIIIGAVLYAAVVVLNVYLTGPTALFSGWIWKCGVIYLLISGFRYARSAEEIKKQLEMLG